MKDAGGAANGRNSPLLLFAADANGGQNLRFAAVFAVLVVVGMLLIALKLGISRVGARLQTGSSERGKRRVPSDAPGASWETPKTKIN